MNEALNNGKGEKSCVTDARRPKAGNVSKADTRYWLAKVKRPRYVKDGKMVESADFAASIQFRGKRINWSLGTPNKTAAANTARDIYLSLRASGWDATIAKYRPAMAEKVASPSVAQFLEAVEATSDLEPRTLATYERALRRIASDVIGIPRTGKHHDVKAGGREAWLEKVGKIRLDELSQDRLQKWKKDFLKQAGQDVRKQASARVSVNSLIRSACSLFAPGVLKHVAGSLQLPNPLPFSELDFEPMPSTKYKGTFDAEKLIQEARAELDEEPLKIFLLAISAGLRRGEIDSLPWSAFLWDKSSIRIEETQFWSPKTKGSSADLLVDPDVMEIFRGFRARASGEFVIESDRQPRAGLNWHEYRAEPHFKRLTEWLRGKGLPAKSPLHTLRKEYGSKICQSFGIYSASAMLRHASIKTTEKHYLDHRAPAVFRIGHLLKGEAETKVVPMQQPEPKQLQKSG